MKFGLIFPVLLILILNGSLLVYAKLGTRCVRGEKATKLNEKYLAEHNEYRSRHGVPPLKLDQQLMDDSIKWSEYLAKTDSFEHSNDSYSYGESLFKMAPVNDELDLNPIYIWYNEIRYYKKPGGFVTGHFTKIVWKNSKKVGCGVCISDKLAVVTCRYTPEGNIEGQFDDNVLPSSFTPKKDKSSDSEEDDDSVVQKLMYIMSFAVLLVTLPAIFILVLIIYRRGHNL